MTFDAKDRALNAASSLIGYCMSATNLPLDQLPKDDFEIIKRWIHGLLGVANIAAVAIDEAMEEK